MTFSANADFLKVFYSPVQTHQSRPVACHPLPPACHKKLQEHINQLALHLHLTVIIYFLHNFMTIVLDSPLDQMLSSSNLAIVCNLSYNFKDSS